MKRILISLSDRQHELLKAAMELDHAINKSAYLARLIADRYDEAVLKSPQSDVRVPRKANF